MLITLRRLFSCLFVSFCFCAFAPLLASVNHNLQASAHISGLVVDSADKGIPDVTVVVTKDCKCSDCEHKCTCCPDQISANTNQSGAFAVNVTSGTYTLQVHSDQGSGSITVTVQEGDNKNVKIVISDNRNVKTVIS